MQFVLANNEGSRLYDVEIKAKQLPLRRGPERRHCAGFSPIAPVLPVRRTVGPRCASI